MRKRLKKKLFKKIKFVIVDDTNKLIASGIKTNRVWEFNNNSSFTAQLTINKNNVHTMTIFTKKPIKRIINKFI